MMGEPGKGYAQGKIMSIRRMKGIGGELSRRSVETGLGRASWSDQLTNGKE